MFPTLEPGGNTICNALLFGRVVMRVSAIKSTYEDEEPVTAISAGRGPQSKTISARLRREDVVNKGAMRGEVPSR